MKAIEFIGPSGAGKTFLYNKLFSDSEGERKYFNLTEATINAASKLNLTNIFSAAGIMQVILRLNFLNWKKNGLARKILEEAIRRDSEDLPGSFSTSFNILMRYMLSEKDPSIVYKRLDNFKSCMEQYQLLEKYTGKNDLVIFDEGLLHHHHGLHPDLTEEYTMNEIAADSALRPEAVISCELSADEVFERALKRRQAGINTFSHRFLTDFQLKEYIKRNVEEYQFKRTFLEMTGIPVLRIDTAESHQVNTLKIKSFINSFISS